MLNIAVIMAGGSGSRFFPLSNSKTPKQLLKLENEKSMLRNTVDRVSDVVGIENVFISTRKDILENVKMDLGCLIADDHYIVEPFGKNTAPCIALSLGYVSAICGTEDLCIGFFPADHVIEETIEGLFEDEDKSPFYQAYSLAQRFWNLGAIGIEPKGPHTGYGYLEVYRSNVMNFREKPDIETAKEYIKSGNYLWNSGMYFGNFSIWKETFEKHCPNLVCLIDLVSKNYGEKYLDKLVDCVWEHVKPCSVDKAIMEKYDKMFCVYGGFEWNDFGTWSSLAEFNFSKINIQPPCDKENLNFVLGELESIKMSNTQGCILGNFDSGMKIGLLGVKDLIVVVNDGKILVCSKDREQDIGKIAELMED